VSWRLHLRIHPRRLLKHPHHDLFQKTHGALGLRSNEEGISHVHLRARRMVWMSLLGFPRRDALSQACNPSQRGPLCDWSHHPMSRRCWRSFLHPRRPLHHRLAVGAMSINVPKYNAEVAPPGVRGSLVALQQLAITAGIMVSFWIDYGTNNVGGTGSTQSNAAWLVPICLQLIPGVALGVGLLLIAILFGIKHHQCATHKATGWAVVTFVWLFVINFGYI